jgi:hypothetical protein
LNYLGDKMPRTPDSQGDDSPPLLWRLSRARWLYFRAAIADDRVPVTVRLFLSVRRDLEGKGLAVLERRAAVEAETGNAQNGELHRQFIARLAAGVVTGRLVNSRYFTIRKDGGVEARRLMRILA